MFAGKPVIGIVGGIGSGKSFVADLFGELGCMVSKSDEHVREAYERPEVLQLLREWWGDAVIDAGGKADRKAIAQRVFGDRDNLRRLEALVHPLVGEIRDRHMAAHASDPAVRAYIWDMPLLYEVGLDRLCDAVVFVDAPLEERLNRVKATRGWEGEELLRREKSQLPLDNKRKMAQYMVDNTADAAYARRQVEAVLSRVLTQTPNADPVTGERVEPK